MLEPIVIVAAYLLGGVNAGYYIVRYASGVDVRQTGSGGTGGTNVARILGRWARPVVGGLDVLKGAAIVAVAQWAGLGAVALGAVVFATVLGNVYPVQLGLRGGKGIGTSLGAFLVFSPQIAVAICILTVVLYLLTGRQQVSGVAAYATAAAISPWTGASSVVSAAVIATSALVIFANRVNFLEDLHGSR